MPVQGLARRNQAAVHTTTRNIAAPISDHIEYFIRALYHVAPVNGDLGARRVGIGAPIRRHDAST
jgi:hypothetical protein